MSVTLCVLLWATEGRHEDLVAYEDTVLEFLPDHDARVVQRVRTRGQPLDQPYEVHVLEFASEEALDGYLQDPRRVALAEHRDRVINRSEILRVEAQ